MSRGDDDFLDFDFVEDDRAASQDARTSRFGRPAGSPRPPALKLTKKTAALLRLTGLIAGLITVAVLVITLTGALSGETKQSSYRAHMSRVEAIGLESSRIGTESTALLSAPGVTQKTLERDLLGLIQQQQLNLSQAESLDPPGPLTAATHGAIEALQLRLIGLKGLLAVIRTAASEKDSAIAAQQLAAQAGRLIASDVIWEDAFMQAAIPVLTERNVAGAVTPASTFVEDVGDWDVRRLQLLHQRLKGIDTRATPTPGIHGSLLEGVTVNPGGTSLTPGSEATVTASADLAFEVTVRNSGESPEIQVQVSLTIATEPTPIVKTGTIEAINPGESATVVFDNLPEVPMGQKTAIQVSIKPVPGEANTDNNVAEYPVVFSL